MTRARGDEEMSEEKKGEEALDLEEGSFRKLVVEWNGPDRSLDTHPSDLVHSGHD